MIYVTGDMHGDMTRFDEPAMKTLKKNDILIICGDFGFIWDGSEYEENNLRKLAKKRFTICFVDGTHENFDILNSYPVTMRWGGKVHKIADNIYHLCRGQIFEFSSVKVFAMGGGESPDIDIRFEKNAWSKSEFPERRELLEGAENMERAGCHVDFVITHEPPTKVKSFLKLKDGEDIHINALNTYFEELAENCNYRHWFFGSMHLDKLISAYQTAVYRRVINALTGEIIE